MVASSPKPEPSSTEVVDFPKEYHYRDIEEVVSALWTKTASVATDFSSDGTLQHAPVPQEKSEDEGRQKDLLERKAYSMVIPPPNVTGRLHMGHALNNTLQDMIIRYKRMCGYDALWVPGTDHAGIATQTVVKKMLDAKGIDYRELGREKFVEHVFEWKEKYGEYILKQIQQIGCSCDWDRVRFTMDKSMVTAVNTAFVRLHQDGLIYKGRRIVNWCPVDQTALADDEVDVAPGGESGFLHEILYPFAETNPSQDGLKGLIVSTTRPETLFGDVAVAVHPEDPRYKKFIGKKLRLPLTDRTIPIIADAYVEKSFGTGCLKITPGHDKNDFEIGQRHDLPILNVMHEDARMNETAPPPFAGLTREACREKVVATLETQKLLIRKVPHQIPIGRSYRSKAIIEYRVSEQWFVRMKPLAENLLKADEKLNFYPPRLEKVYLGWLTDIEDWCISRQIWWGHRIPAWIHSQTGEVRVGLDQGDALKDIPKEEWDQYEQENDVLDTWFSSALWPFSTMGWPNEGAPDFKRYFPTATLSTAKDIIFFWVARMALLSWHFMKQLPFENVFIHPTILDDQGRTMSKSKGNGIDPDHIINGATVETMKQPVLDARPSDMDTLLKKIEAEYQDGFPGVGADALRYTLLYLLTSAQSVQIALKDFTQIGRRFTTKFWNASRLVLLRINDFYPLADEERKTLLAEMQSSMLENASDRPSEDQWMEIECFLATKKMTQAYEEFDFSGMGEIVYKLVWANFCDHYLEMLKPRLTGKKLGQKQGASPSLENADQDGKPQDAKHQRIKQRIKQLSALAALLRTFRHLLLLLHPIIPFMTEYIWDQLHVRLGPKSELSPELIPPLMKTTALSEKNFSHLQGNQATLSTLPQSFSALKRILSKVRALRKRYGISEAILLPITVDISYTSDDGNVSKARPLDADGSHEHANLDAERSGDETTTDAKTGTATTETGAGGMDDRVAFQKFLQGQRELITGWMRLTLTESFSPEQNKRAVTLHDALGVFSLDISEYVNWESERERLLKEKVKLDQNIKHIETRLANPKFVANAKPDFVAAEENRLKQFQDTLVELQRELSSLTERLS